MKSGTYGANCRTRAASRSATVIARGQQSQTIDPGGAAPFPHVQSPSGASASPPPQVRIRK
ncbi:hypothetical protein AVDCRST_MAG94-3517, partial [uncultured Leptolyngbya sp.]